MQRPSPVASSHPLAFRPPGLLSAGAAPGYGRRARVPSAVPHLRLLPRRCARRRSCPLGSVYAFHASDGASTCNSATAHSQLRGRRRHPTVGSASIQYPSFNSSSRVPTGTPWLTAPTDNRVHHHDIDCVHPRSELRCSGVKTPSLNDSRPCDDLHHRHHRPPEDRPWKLAGTNNNGASAGSQSQGSRPHWTATTPGPKSTRCELRRCAVTRCPES